MSSDELPKIVLKNVLSDQKNSEYFFHALFLALLQRDLFPSQDLFEIMRSRAILTKG